MRIIYVPSGKAAEYAKLAANYFRGCEHGCLFCYAPGILGLSRKDFCDKARLRFDASKILRMIDKDCKELRDQHDEREILLSFSHDPYMQLEAESQITRSIIKKFIAHGLRFTVLTKGGLRSTRDFDLLSAYKNGARYGVTLTTLDQTLSEQWEGESAPPLERLAALQVAHQKGIPTWASVEPVILPGDALSVIRSSCEYVDNFMVGKMNHLDPAWPGYTALKAIDWVTFREDVTELLEALKRDQIIEGYYIKKSLRSVTR